jgi:Helix-turn-helix domain
VKAASGQRTNANEPVQSLQLGKPLSRMRSLGLSVLRTCVTKQTKDLRYRDVEPLWFLSFGLTHDDAVCPWKESCIVDQRLQFLSSYQKEEMSVSDFCREFGVSRPTGYRWINRYKESGPEGLLNLSSKPHSCSHAIAEPIECAILALRGK